MLVTCNQLFKLWARHSQNKRPKRFFFRAPGSHSSETTRPVDNSPCWKMGIDFQRNSKSNTYYISLFLSIHHSSLILLNLKRPISFFVWCHDRAGIISEENKQTSWLADWLADSIWRTCLPISSQRTMCNHCIKIQLRSFAHVMLPQLLNMTSTSQFFKGIGGRAWRRQQVIDHALTEPPRTRMNKIHFIFWLLLWLQLDGRQPLWQRKTLSFFSRMKNAQTNFWEWDSGSCYSSSSRKYSTTYV